VNYFFCANREKKIITSISLEAVLGMLAALGGLVTGAHIQGQPYFGVRLLGRLRD